MKCKRCRSTVPDSVEVCPNCGQDLSSLRKLLSDFYSDEPIRAEEPEPAPSEPEVFSKTDPKTALISAEDLGIITGPEPDYRGEFSLGDVLSAEEPERDDVREMTPSWDRALRGGFWVRGAAFVTDQLILLILLAIFVVLGFITLALGSSEGRGISVLEQARIVLPAILPLALALNLAYFSFFHGTWGQTIGKMIFGLRVVRPDGASLSYPRALLRAVGYFVSTAPFFLGFYWVAFTTSKKGWHDILMDTIVIREQ